MKQSNILDSGTSTAKIFKLNVPKQNLDSRNILKNKFWREKGVLLI
jgi:hypothetical protein